MKIKNSSPTLEKWADFRKIFIKLKVSEKFLKNSLENF